VRVITADEIRRAVEPLDLVDAMREAFVSISSSRVRTTFSLLDLDEGDVHIKAAHDAGGDTYVVKIASAVPTNRQRSLPIGKGGILICSAITGEPRAFFADEHHLTDARTAAAGALATDLLAAPDARTLTVLGAGVQARLLLARLRPLQQVIVWARRSAAAERLADELRAMLENVGVETTATVREAVLSSEIVVAATASTEPLIDGDWLRPGQHVTALTATDVATFYRALLSGGLLRPDLLRAMETTVAEGPRQSDIPGQRSGLGLEEFPTPCGAAYGHNGTFPGYLVYAFTSKDGRRQAVLMVNESAESLPKQFAPSYFRLLASAYCQRTP
jgi:ornithine cyclodeaminase/alanine dehydrogenase-like protein (mu-crystallin family)